MNTTSAVNTPASNPSEPPRPTQPRRLSTLRTLGRGLAATSAVALMGVGAMSTADASAAGVAHGIRYSASSPTDQTSASALPSTTTRQLAIRDGKLHQI